MINRKLKTGVCIFLIACVFSACSGDAKKKMLESQIMR